MRRIFTERFFRLSAHDQVAVVEAVLQDIEKNYGRYITPDDEKRARRQAGAHPKEGDGPRDIEGLSSS